MQRCTCIASGVLCCDLRTLGPFKASLCFSGLILYKYGGRNLQMCLITLFPCAGKYPAEGFMGLPWTPGEVWILTQRSYSRTDHLPWTVAVPGGFWQVFNMGWRRAEAVICTLWNSKLCFGTPQGTCGCSLSLESKEMEEALYLKVFISIVPIQRSVKYNQNADRVRPHGYCKDPARSRGYGAWAHRERQQAASRCAQVDT